MDMIICFLHWIAFSFLELKKIQLQTGKKYSILLSTNELAECNRLKNKTNTVKHHYEKIKMSSNKVLEEELVIK